MKKIACLLVVLCVFLCGASPAQMIRIEELKITDGPASKWVSKYKGAVVWYTNQASSSLVRWGETPEHGRTTRGEDGLRHQVRLSPLKGGTTYYYRVVSKTEDGEEVESSEHSFTTPTSDIAVASAKFPPQMILGDSYNIEVATYLRDEPLDAPYSIKIYRRALDGSGKQLGEDVLLGAASVAPHPVDTYRMTGVKIQVKPLPGLSEGFQKRDIFVVELKAGEPEDRVENNDLEISVPVVHH